MTKNSPNYPALASYILGAASTAVGLNANAFQLGQLESQTRIGEPLAAYIRVVMSPRESQLPTALQLLPAFPYRNDAAMIEALANVRATLIQNDYGNHYIALTGASALNIPALAFRIKAENGDTTLIRNYTFAPNIPVSNGLSRSQVPTQTRRPKNVIRAGAASGKTSRAAPSNQQATQWQVKAGDSLWKIANKIATNSTEAGQLVNQLFELNPQAFINGDINKLKQGVMLRLPGDSPSADLAIVESIEPAPTATSSQPATTDATVEVPEQAIRSEEFIFDEPLVDLNTENSDDLISIAADAKQNITVNVDWQRHNPDLAERLNALGDKYAAIRARYLAQQPDIDNTEANELADVAAQSNEDLFTPAASNVNEIALPDQDVAESTRTSSFVAMEPEESLQSAEGLENPRNNRFALPWWAIGLVGLVALISAGGLVYHRSRVAMRRKLDQAKRQEDDLSLKRELAKKAQQRVQMEDEVERMLYEHNHLDDSDEIEKTMQLHVDEIIPQEFTETVKALEDTPQSKIDASIAHGRYGEAEELLREVIAGSPRNFAAKLRLAEVFYITERIEDFVDVSRDIYDHHRPDISDEDWRRVMRMGKMIAPEEAPFSGPQSIIGDASAG